MTRIAIDPVTRIEGHLRIEVEHDSDVVQDAWSTGTMFRGIEQILAGRDPRQAWVFAQRACGVCTHVHALASVRAVENALGIAIPPNARIIRNLMSGVQFVHDHVIHFYHLHALDWVDIVAALSADPAATASLCQATNPGWANSSTAYFTEVRTRLQAFVDSGQLGPFAAGYWGHPAYQLPAEANLLLVAHYLEALEWQREIIKIHAILGGKNPHPQTYTVGGMALTLAPDAPSGVNTTALGTIGTLLTSIQNFVSTVLVGDVKLLARYYQIPWTTLGAGPGNLLSYGEFPEADGASPAPFLPAGRVTGRDLGSLGPVDQAAIAETVARSWYTYSSGDSGARHPSAGETTPTYTGPQPPYDNITTTKYSWLKAPRYDGAVYEVGPLARLGVAYAVGVAPVRQAVDAFLSDLGLGQAALFSTIGRLAARALETQLLADRLPTWLAALRTNITGGDLRIADTTRWSPDTWPATASGWGPTEAPRGGLGHWIAIAGGSIANYQMVVPSTWNGSPRDAAGALGPWEQALVGTPLVDPTRPVEVLRTVHSFDPCMACAVHVHRPGS
ncbi:MAG: nickel-dependent hydrogenase large subunit [Dactylosporangium sp.]|nr:nickel-dependent hydrogenase large subunit [Dactylosporangium sp.]NNJ62375.1 nickel-dependent hydrogenase large subunit [Dactylosporangium sp.]